MVADYAVHYPFNYTQDDQVLLSPYMQLPDQDTQQQIKQWTQQLWQAGEKIQTYTALQRIASHIFKNFTYKLREEPGVQTAKETLACNTGSCRDFAQLFMDAAKCMGMAARFVTGYLHAPGLDAAGATHAWAEVYLPGAGWKGFDPTIGAMAGTDHIPVAVARLSKSVPPIEGSFIGEPKSTLDVGVWVSKLA